MHARTHKHTHTHTHAHTYSALQRRNVEESRKTFILMAGGSVPRGEVNNSRQTPSKASAKKINVMKTGALNTYLLK